MTVIDDEAPTAELSRCCASPHSPTDSVPEGWRREAVAMLLAIVAGAILLLMLYEWPRYRRWLGTETLTGGASLLVLWTVWAKSMAMALPGTVAAAYVARLGRPRLGWALWSFNAAIVGIWIILDGYVYGMNGRHITWLLRFAGEHKAVAWIGGVGRWIVPIGVPVLAVLVGVGLLGAGSRWAARSRRRAWSRRDLGGLVVIVLAAVLMPLGLQHYIHGAALMERTRMLFPLDVRWAEQGFRPRTVDDPIIAAIEEAVKDPLAAALPWALAPAPLDRGATFTATADSPNVIVLILESYSPFLEGYELMPKLRARAAVQGITARRHSSGSNHSEAGLFTLLYSFPALSYYPTLEVPVHPQMCYSFAASGYQTHYYSGARASWMGMERFINLDHFDEIADIPSDERDWPHSDRTLLEAVKRAAQTRGDRPLFAMGFIMSSHFPYSYPPEYASIDAPVPAARRTPFDYLLDDQAAYYREYRRALTFLDDELDRLLESIDLTRNIVVITGDHGQTLFDDSVLGHNSRMSDAQVLTPLFIFGPNVPARTIESATTHADLLPTLLHAAAGKPVAIAGGFGRDLLADTDSPRDVVVCSVQPSVVALSLMRGRERLNLNVYMPGGDFQLQGFANEFGEVITSHGITMADVPAWAAALEQMFDRLAVEREASPPSGPN